jgi:putative PIN family toxin of toxin-antitoxin system
VVSVTADTNIYISALNFGGNPLQLLNLAEAGGIRLAVSDAIMAEIGEVLRGDKFQWPEEEIEKAQKQIARFTQRVTPTERLDVIKDDPPDNRVLECAAAAKSDYIVSGDNHLLRLQRYGNARILKVAEFMDIARGESRAPGPQH